MPSVDLRYEADVIRAVAADAADVEWVRAALACGFESVTASRPDAVVKLTVDGAAAAALLAQGRAAGDAEGFALDADRHVVERWGGDGEAHIVRDPALPGFYRVSRVARAVEIVAARPGRRCRMALLRAVRELAMDRVVASGGVLVHGAAVLADGGAIALSAPKRHGKTTLLLALLTQTPAIYVGNDRCVLRVGDGGATLRGLPTIVSLTRHGLDRLPAVRDRLFAVRPELAGAGGAGVGLSPDEFVRVLSAPQTVGGPVAAFVFPRITAHGPRLALRRLGADEALERFRQGLFRAQQATVLGEVFASERARGLAPWPAGEAAGRWIAAHRPCFAADLGDGGPPSAADCRALLAAVAAARAGRQAPGLPGGS